MKRNISSEEYSASHEEDLTLSSETIAYNDMPKLENYEGGLDTLINTGTITIPNGVYWTFPESEEGQTIDENISSSDEMPELVDNYSPPKIECNQQ